LLKFDYFYWGSVTTVNEIQTILWHLQKDLAPFRWGKLGEIVYFLDVSIRFYLFILQKLYFWDLVVFGANFWQVCCDGCNVWVHAECDKISSELLKV